MNSIYFQLDMLAYTCNRLMLFHREEQTTVETLGAHDAGYDAAEIPVPSSAFWARGMSRPQLQRTLAGTASI
jgi:hypothetical protein